jgi:hypothetical protein
MALSPNARGKESFGVWMKRLFKESVHTVFLHNLTCVHNQHTVRHLGNDTQVVADHDDGHALIGLEFSHEIHDLSLDGHVKGCSRLVCNDQLRLAAQRHGDHDTLSHAPA